MRLMERENGKGASLDHIVTKIQIQFQVQNFKDFPSASRTTDNNQSCICKFNRFFLYQRQLDWPSKFIVSVSNKLVYILSILP